jgi:serine/threonine protein kinase
MEFIKILGKGTFGSVSLYKDTLLNKEIAIKHIPYKSEYQNEIIMHNVLTGHKNIIDLIYVNPMDDHMSIILEYAEGGDLFTYVRNKIKLSENECKYFILQIIEAIEHCHMNNIVHCDIKLENILLTKDHVVKLADFGYSHYNLSIPNFVGGTIPYIAPEMIKKTILDETKLDIYAIGVCLYILLHGKYPFEANNLKEIYLQIILNKYTISDDISIICTDLLIKLLEPDPDKRISIEQIKKHPWFLKKLNI